MRPRPYPILSMLLALTAAGCEPGLEAAGVREATASRLEDDRVSVAVTLACQEVYGLPRADGKCDADDDRICVSARWYAADDLRFESPLTTVEQCQKVPSIEGMQLTLTSPDAVAKDPGLRILIQADPLATGIILANP
ncbi:hypothetical protein D7Y13_25940 [Corallococcus praedator]|uniref:Lipoprotein n=1 Tax=Corallococcus praedator TaxID=2316724 RepID=A0ABX9QEF6_9BACT|nr:MULTISPECIES: hypothetical protein [Corallococcus]RKI00949.1 hypothetical protein D7Y13_25940 [Corallococcus praedator]